MDLLCVVGLWLFCVKKVMDSLVPYTHTRTHTYAHTHIQLAQYGSVSQNNGTPGLVYAVDPIKTSVAALQPMPALVLLDSVCQVVFSLEYTF